MSEATLVKPPAGRAGGAGARVAAVLLALLSGVLAAMAGARAAEPFAPDPDLAAVAAAAYPGAPYAVEADPFRHDEPAWLRFMMARDDPVPTWWLAPREQPATADIGRYRAAARDRFAAAGWRVEDGDPDGMAFRAVRGDVRADFHADIMDPDGPHTFVDVRKLQAWWVTAAAVLCGLAGAAAAWLLVGWVARRTAGRSPRARALVREATVVGLVLAAPLFAQTALAVLTGATMNHHGLPFGDLVIAWARWLAVPALVLGVAVVAVAATSTPLRAPSSDRGT